MPIATNLIVTTKNGNKTKTTNITYANPEAADSSLATFAASLFSLSQNELVSIDRVNKTGLEIPAVQPAGKPVPTLSANPASIDENNGWEGNITVTTNSNGAISAKLYLDGEEVTDEEGAFEPPTVSDNVISLSRGLDYPAMVTYSYILAISVAETDEYAAADVNVPITITSTNGGAAAEEP